MIAAEIEESMDLLDKKITWKDLATAVKLSPGSLTNLKNGAEMKFPTLLEIAKFIYKNEHINRFKKWCLNFDSPKNLRFALEYLAVNRQLKELDELIMKITKQRTDQTMKEWAQGYSILSRYLKREKAEDIINELRGFTPKTKEMQILALITEVWCRYKLNDFKTMSLLISGLEYAINKINEDFIRDSYGIRLNEVLAYVNLYKFNNITLAREIAEKIIFSNCSATFTTSASYILGMSFLFDNYEKCLGYIERHRELLVESGRLKELEVIDNCDIPFINNVWRKQERPNTNDISELAHFEAVVGNKELALELINKAIENEEKEGRKPSGFKFYYKALATNDASLFMKSLIMFSKNGDKFYANLPYKYLKEDETFKSMAALLIDEEN
ncbi:AimR family lysis-lysogeny pheromone receptor [Cytobacillus massiliigabonensis]|uniref:AimR family lysis-lysogeny pheromone receptor n=1 Tax=Cytobacillus massiliigabonensis TaxID=1871011 RepID=UPI000C8279E6|nr:AimR family lysis-lysogeny pheromone receptor [Cytobacillus massiliigabonensis]